MNKAEVLDKARELVGGDRADDYGDARENHQRIADLWSVILGQELQAWQVALCMAMVKAARLVNTPDHEDSWVDMAGYAAIGGEIQTGGGRGTSADGAIVDELQCMDGLYDDGGELPMPPIGPYPFDDGGRLKPGVLKTEPYAPGGTVYTIGEDWGLEKLVGIAPRSFTFTPDGCEFTVREQDGEYVRWSGPFAFGSARE